MITINFVDYFSDQIVLRNFSLLNVIICKHILISLFHQNVTEFVVEIPKNDSFTTNTSKL